MTGEGLVSRSAMHNSKENPYLTFVMISRNDDYGGNALRRMQISINGRLEQLEKHKIDSEFILIEWNPPADKPSLKDAINWPKNLKYCTIRLIVVPPEIHNRYEYSNQLNMNTAVAINSGIRRARGKFVLPGNIDLLYSNELMAYFAKKQLKEGERYRIDRLDVDKNVVQYNTLQEQLDYCRDHIIKANVQDRFYKREKLPHLHTNASGDFQLMSRHYWHLLRGYREADILSAYGDGLLSFASYAAGVREVVLKDPLRLYHIDHSGKFDERPMGDGLPFENRLKLPFLPKKFNNYLLGLYRIVLTAFGYKLTAIIDGIPTLHYTEYRKMAREMVAGKRSYILNSEDWGLGKETLEEHIINRADWDKDYGEN
jgi:hypothetical protein